MAATIDEFVHQQQWMDRHGVRESLWKWDEDEVGVCWNTLPDGYHVHLLYLGLG
jgi:hypothetical protein